MKEFLKKHKKLLVILLIVFLVIGTGVGIYFIFFNDVELDSNVEKDSVVVEDATPEELTPEPSYVLKSSKDAMLATYTEAKTWSSDVKLYECSGLTISSVQYPDVTYYFLGSDSGSYSKWICTYYSKSKGQTSAYLYEEGVVDSNVEPMDIGGFGSSIYDSVSYPTNFGNVVDSTVIYASAVENGLDIEKNFVNMYLGDEVDHGYVWKVDERSRTEQDEFGTGLLLNTYVFDIYSGSLKTILKD
ncbi:hypothetical protein K8R14_03915 [bacterium]|nr:hypothetical protein [bacterium]